MDQSVAPWWHTALVLLVLFMGSAASAHQHGFPSVNLPGISARLSGYLTVFAEEWLLVLFIWLWLRRRAMTLANLISGRWQNPQAIVKDLGLAVGFLLVGIPLTSGLSWLFGATAGMQTNVFPGTPFEAVCWVLLASTAGFCEELIFRGYLTRQFTAWTKGTTLATGLQGLAFGLAHGYQGPRFMVVIAIYGWLFGVFAAWRKSLRPGMLAHGLQDAAGGLVAFFGK